MIALTYIAQISLASGPKFKIGFLWELVLFFSFVGIIYFILVFILKHKLTRKERNTIVFKKDIAPLVSTLLFHKRKATRKEKANFVNAKVHLQQLLKNPENRKMVSEILLDIQSDLAGDTKLRLFKLYQDLGLHNDAIRKLKSWRWEVVCQGITELTRMRVANSYTYIRRFVNDRRSIVRKQAQLATVALKPEGINYFLDTSKHKISEWQQLKLMETLHSLQDFTPPRFSLWLTSGNKDVVLFAVRLIKSFHQDDAMESLLKLVKHRNDSIKIEAIDCMREFKFVKALPLLKAIFWNCRSEVKLTLLTAIGELGSAADIPFLNEVESRASDFVIKSKAIGTINVLAPESILPCDEINDSLENAPVTAAAVGAETDPATHAEDDEAHREFEASLKAPEFQKFDEEAREEELAYDMIYGEGLKNIVVISEVVSAQDEFFIMGEDAIDSHNHDEKSQAETLTKTVEQIQVEYKILDATPDYQKIEDLEVTAELVPDADFEEDLLHFTALSEITDHANYLYDDEDDEEIDEKEIRELYVIYDEVSDMPDLAELVVPFLEIEWPIAEREHVGYHAGEGSIEFDLELYPETFEEKMNLRREHLENYERERESEISYTSAFEELFYASDRDGKLLLLDDMLRLGDERDIIFLRKLRTDKSAIIRQTAERVLNLLTERLYPGRDPETFRVPIFDDNPNLNPAFEIVMEEKAKEEDISGEVGGIRPRRKPEELSLFNDTMRRIQRSMKKSTDG